MVNHALADPAWVPPGRKQLYSFDGAEVGRCRLTISKPVLKASMVSALETRTSLTAFNGCFQFKLAPLHLGGGAAPARRSAEA